MNLRQSIAVGLMTLLMLALAAAAMHVILLNTRPLTQERVIAPDLKQ